MLLIERQILTAQKADERNAEWEMTGEEVPQTALTPELQKQENQVSRHEPTDFFRPFFTRLVLRFEDGS